MKIAQVEQADGHSKHGGAYHQFIKRRKRRNERRRAKQDPECLPAYNRFRRYET